MKKPNSKERKSKILVTVLLVAAAGSLLGVSIYYSRHKVSAVPKKMDNPKENIIAEGGVAATVDGKNIYTKEVWEVVDALEKKAQNPLSKENRDKAYALVLNSQIQSMKKKEALLLLAEEYEVKKIPAEKEKLERIEGALKKDLDAGMEKALMAVTLGVVKEDVEKNILASKKNAIESEVEKITKIEKLITFILFPASNQKEAERVKKALDAESLDKRQGTLETIAVSQGKERPLSRVMTSMQLRKIKNVGEIVVNMKPGDVRTVALGDAQVILLCMKKEALPEELAKEHATKKMVEAGVNAVIKKSEERVKVEGIKKQ